jgi:hypothetical protein
MATNATPAQLTAQITTLEATIASLQAEVTTLQTGLNAIGTALTAANASVAAILADLTAITSPPVSTGTTTITPSASGTVIVPGTPTPIVDASGNTWSFAANPTGGLGTVTENGAPASGGASAYGLLYYSGSIYLLNPSGVATEVYVPVGNTWFVQSDPRTPPIPPLPAA